MTVKYLILIHDDAAVQAMFAGMTDDERAASYQSYWDVVNDLDATGELVDSTATDTGSQRVVRTGDHGPLVTDAPRPEAVPAVSGYYLVDVESEARAAEIAARFPEAKVGCIRVARVLTAEELAAP